MIRKSFVIVLSVLIMFSMCPAVFAAGTPTMTVSSAKARAGDTVTLKVSIANNPGINTFSLGFDYDKSKLQLSDVIIDGNLSGQFVYKKKAVWLNGKDIKYNGDILTLKFKVLDDAKSGETVIKPTYSPGDISNYNEENVNFKVISGAITIENGGTRVSFIQKVVSFFKNLFNQIAEFFNRLFRK